MTGTWQSGWATGDVVTAAEFKKSAGAIFDSTLGASAASIDVTGISATYAHLMMTLYSRGDAAAGFIGNNMRFNGDTAANYDTQYLLGLGATPSSAEAFAQTSLNIGDSGGNTAGANLFSTQEIFVPNYAGSANNKQVVTVSAAKVATTTGSLAVRMLSGSWRSSAAINRVTVFPSSGNFVAGTRFTIHALGA